MAFDLSSEQQMIRLMAGDFAKKELEPMATDWDRQGTFPLQAIKKMGELGLLGMMVPTEMGGSEAGAVAYSLALQEIAYSCASSAVTMSVANLSTEPLLRFGNKGQMAVCAGSGHSPRRFRPDRTRRWLRSRLHDHHG